MDRAVRLVIALAAVLPCQLVAQARRGAQVRAVPERWTLASTGNQVSFTVREQLAGAELPNDAVGTTQAITASIALDANGQPDPARSSIAVDLRTLSTDKPNRDSYIKRRTLVTDSFPNATFNPDRLALSTGAIGTPGPIAGTLSGTMTMHGTAHPVTWQVTGTVTGDTVSGRATTHVHFGDFAMERPHLMIVMSVVDDVRLDYDFRFVRVPAT